MNIFLVFFAFFENSATLKLICNDVWYDTADFLYSCQQTNCSMQALRVLQPSTLPIVFVPQQFITLFVQHAPTFRYIVVSATHVDQCAPYGKGVTGGGESLLNDDALVAWFATNVAVRHPKLQPLPIGPRIQWHTRWFHQELDSKQSLITLLRNNSPKRNFFDNKRPFFIDLQLNVKTADFAMCKVLPSHLSRRAAMSHFERISKHLQNELYDCPMEQQLNEEPLLNDSEHRSQIRYFNKLRCTKFVPAPEGSGLDSHRVYEALMMGAIPIVVNFEPFEPLYAGLPILKVENWSVVTLRLLKETYETFHSTAIHYNWERLESEVWINEIMQTKIQ